jgi:outer membrane receptor protein involved in Fe transport
MNPSRNTFRRHALGVAVCLVLASAAQAQVSTSTIKGQISSDSKPAQSGLAVTAVNKANGTTYRTTTLADGSYVLTGLAPGEYEIRVVSAAGTVKTEAITLQVGETASMDLALGGTQQITIVGSALRRDVKTSEVGTNVSRKMIESLPQTTRNFLSSADLAPGVAFSTDSGGNTKIQSGAQNFDHVNVFIDGVGQKNNILRGGLSGQDSTRGNPFPQSAIAEYKVLTQNYKAEFDQVSSAAITAITKSGTNELHGEVYVDRTGTNWRAMSVFEKERAAQGVPLPPSSKNEFGFSVGGPIKQDQVHFFFAYDGKEIADSRQVVPRNLNLLPTGAGIVPGLIAAQGNQVDHFREHLLFGKIDAQLNDEQRLSASLKLRRESDRVAEDRDLSAPGNDKDRKNEETRFDIKHEWARGPWLSEARLGYDDALWNPHSASSTAFIKYKVSTAAPQNINNSQDVLFVGGSPDAQRRQQTGTHLSEDLTFTGIQQHVLKGGIKFSAMKYKLSGTAFGVDRVETLIDTTTGLAYYDGSNCTGTTITNAGTSSDQCRISRAIPGASAAFSNNQVGMYLQDDWAVTKQLELNLGVRWDYESNMLNNGYVTPIDRVNALNALEPVDANGFSTRGWPVVPGTDFPVTPGQTYAQSLAKGGIKITDYISNGSSRKVYKGAFAPRLGASYDVFSDRNTVVFGGWGRSFDRTMANHALDELQKNAQANGEIWLIRNDFKMPYADQFTLGLRQALGQWNGELAISSVYAKNQFIWFGGNRDPLGGYAHQSPIDPLWNGPPGFGTLILGDFVGETKTNSVFAKLEKPYTRSSGWSAHFAYTYSDAKTTSKEWNNDIFDWTYGRTGRGWNPSTLVDKHRIVAAGVVDNLLPWGLTLAAKATLASGMPRRLTNCTGGFDTNNGQVGCVSTEGDSTVFRQVDLSISKELKILGNSFSVRGDVLNLFNTTNYGGFDDWVGAKAGPGTPANYLGGDNVNLGKPNSIRGDTRTFRLAVNYRF